MAQKVQNSRLVVAANVARVAGDLEHRALEDIVNEMKAMMYEPRYDVYK